MSEEKKVPHVYTAIVEVAREVSRNGIGKDRVADQGGGGRYKFRGVDDVMNALSLPLANAKLVIIPRVNGRTVTERTNTKGTVMSYAVVDVEYDFVSAVDGSVHTARTMGEAMDTSDKATNKAMSAAYKYVCFQVFCIPTEGEGDSENHSHEKTSDTGRDLTGPLAQSVAQNWPAYASRMMSGLRSASKHGKGALQEEWSQVYEDMARAKPPKEIRDEITGCKDELKASLSGGAAHP